MSSNVISVRTSEESQKNFNELFEQGEFKSKNEFLDILMATYQESIELKTVDDSKKKALSYVESISQNLCEAFRLSLVREEDNLQQIKEKYEKQLSEQQTALNEWKERAEQLAEQLKQATEEKERVIEMKNSIELQNQMLLANSSLMQQINDLTATLENEKQKKEKFPDSK